MPRLSVWVIQPTLIFILACIGALTVATTDEPTPSNSGSAALSITRPGLPHLYQLNRRLYSGGTPEGVPGFESLKELGVRTIISVDGARPDTELIHKAGLRVVHIPIGYDGINDSQAARMVRALRESQGPVYVHCHHGQHRGPAAAAVLARAELGWNSQVANQWLVQAGTSNRYPGLYQSGCHSALPTANVLASLTPADLPEISKVPDLVEKMVEIDVLHDQLKTAMRVGAKAGRTRRDQAQLLLEALKEAGRTDLAGTPDPEKSREFQQRIVDSTQSLDRLIDQLESGKNSTLELQDSLEHVGKSCTSCHAALRD